SMATAHPGSIVVGVDRGGTIRALAKPVFLDNAGKRGHFSRSMWLKVLYKVDPRLPTILGWGHRWYGYAPRRYDPHELHYFILYPDKTIIAQLGSGVPIREQLSAMK